MALALTDLSVNEQVSVFNDTITSIMLNFVLNFIIVYDDWDLPWMKHHIKNLNKGLYKDNFNKNFARGKKTTFHLLTFNNLQSYLNQFIQNDKQKYFNKVAKYHTDLSNSTKCY